MKHLFYTLLLAACACSGAMAQGSSTTTKKIAMATVQQKTDKQMLSELNAKFIHNFITQDTVAHNEIIYRDFVCIQGSGEIMNREDYMKEWAHGYETSGYKSFSHTEEYIRLFGNIALVRSKTPYTKMVDGKLVNGASVYTDTYMKENGRWWCIQAHITGIKQ
jgi:hypothetical protein